MSDHPYLGAFRTDAPILLRRAPNGGWIVEARGMQMGDMPDLLGAFSSAKDMLFALGEALLPGDEP